MFTAEELAGMRDTQEDALPETASIYSVPLSSDGQGGYTEDALSLLSTAACRVAPAEGMYAQMLAERLGVLQLWRITLPAGTIVAHANRIVVSGVTYQVIEDPSRGSWETATRVLCQMVT